jgi:NapC/NirT cytochrome c family, N-terminal region
MTRHPLSLVGAWIVTLSAFTFLFVFVIDLFGLHHNPYFGLLFFLILPVFFVLGLLMIPVGIVLERRRVAKGLAPRRWPRIDLNDRRYQRGAVLVGALTIVNILIVSLAAYRGLEYMDTPTFCGQVCHTVMEPEAVAHREGPHARVPCVDCHVGPGAAGFIQAKLNGMHQVVSLTRGTYPRPVPSPVSSMRPARETCEHCHWPEKFHGDKLEEIREYASDEKSTETVTTLVLHVGGGTHRFGLKPGLHWHADVDNEVDYVATDATRQTIPYVRVKDSTGTVREYRAPDVTDAQIAGGERRRMDCIDCHNRPTHSFAASPERAVDGAIANGAISTSLPFVRREAVAALKVGSPDRASADRTIAERLRAFYKAHPSAPAAEIDRLVTATQFLYARNVFPAMKVTWGTHPNNVGHTDSPGCFRCHDDQHKAADGKVIRQDCDLCHDMK